MLPAVFKAVMKNNKKIKYIAVSALFAALIFGASMLRFPAVSSQGYIHAGDGIMYLAASLLPFPYAAMAAAIGGVLSDVLTGYFIWVPFTAVIKVLNVIPFTLIKKHRKSNKAINAYHIFACLVSGIITCIMYFFASRIIYGSWEIAVADLWGNVIQAAASAAVYIVLRSVGAAKISIDKDD